MHVYLWTQTVNKRSGQLEVYATKELATPSEVQKTALRPKISLCQLLRHCKTRANIETGGKTVLPMKNLTINHSVDW